MYNLNVNYVVECVRNIRINTQCATCDALTGPCVRFPCGHSVCESCAVKAGECLFCISSSNNSYEVDNPQTARLNNASALLTAFQYTFKIDVDKRQHISDHLKLEKEIFSECIQAPNKYINKRKSLNTLSTNKENIPTVFLGEQIISPDTIMKKNQYVQNWLNQIQDIPQNVPRKPFGDINVNIQVKKGKKYEGKVRKGNTQLNSTKDILRKKTQLKTTKSPSLLINMDKEKDRQNKLNNLNKQKVEIKNFNNYEDNIPTYKCDRNESGIVIDDEPILIDDININEKDDLACLAVLEAAKRDEIDKNLILQKSRLQTDTNLIASVNNSSSIQNENKPIEYDANVSRKVLFYKRSTLFETCKHCNHSDNNINPNHKLKENNDVSVVINNSAFVTTIKFTNITHDKQKIGRKKSVATQTDKSVKEFNNNATENTRLKRKPLLNDEVIPIKILKPNIAIQNLDTLPTDKVNEFGKLKTNFCNNDKAQNNFDYSKQSYHKEVEESDTNSNASHDNFHEVVAEVHRNSANEIVEQGVLSTLPRNQYQNRCKQPLRGKTPNSSDSSDKENLDPNRNKGANLKKNQKKKMTMKY